MRSRLILLTIITFFFAIILTIPFTLGIILFFFNQTSTIDHPPAVTNNIDDGIKSSKTSLSNKLDITEIDLSEYIDENTNASFPPFKYEYNNKVKLIAKNQQNECDINETLRYNKTPCVIYTNNSIYEIRLQGMTYSIWKNNQKIWEKYLLQTIYEPIKYNLVIDNDFIIGYDEITENSKSREVISDILINGTESMREKYQLDQAYKPMNFNGELAFLAKKSDQIYLIHKGIMILLNFDLLINPCCCEPAVFAIKNDVNRIDFYAKRGNAWYNVIITVK